MKNANIGKKVTLAFGVVLAVSAATTGVSLWQLDKVTESTKALMEVPLVKERLVSDWYRTIYGGSRRTLAIAKSSDATLVNFFAEDSAKGSKEAGELLKQVQALLTSENETRLLKEISAARDFYIVQNAAVTKAKEAGDATEANRVLDEKFIPASVKYQALLRDLMEMQRKEIDSNAAHIAEASATSVRLQLALTVFLTLLVVACAMLLKRSIVRPLSAAIDVARRVAKGDLGTEVKVTSTDEAGQLLAAMRDMTGSLRGLVDNVMRSGAAIDTASGELARGNQDLSSRTEQQASSLEETASSMEELTSTVRQNADNARQGNQLALSASAVASKGGVVVAQVVGTMGAINASSHKIVDIISVIDGIAFQTNILALNAAVEAARAGDQGRGFAVVASEVRSLAQRSAAAAKEIKSLIDDSVRNVEAGSKLVGEAGATMDDVVTSVRRVTDIMGEIASASVEQSAGIEQVNQAIAQMDQVTQQNAALVEEAAAAAESLQSQAGALAEAVSQFQMGGAVAQPLPAVTASVRMAPTRLPASRQAATRHAPLKRETQEGWEEF